MARVAVVTIHGIGEQSIHFADGFHAKLPRDNRITYHSCYWQDLIEPAEKEQIKITDGLGYKGIRNSMYSYIGDATAYQATNGNDSVYARIHQRLDSVIATARNSLRLDNTADRLYIVAHSLGTIIASNYLWDATNPGSIGNLCFKPTIDIGFVEKQVCLVTLGSPMRLWSLRYPKGGEPVRVREWLNIYSPYDVIGYPVVDINLKYRNATYINDWSLKVGRGLTRYLPSCHGTYFNDTKVLRRLSEELNARIAVSS